MRNILLYSILVISINATAQDSLSNSSSKKSEPDYIPIFSSGKLINANTVEMVPKHILEFKVTHNFGDIGGDNGGAKTFFGLDNASDVLIGFQYGVSKNLNLIAARVKGAGLVQQQYELGAKYRFMQQANDGAHPLSLALFANAVASGMKAEPIPDQENSFEDFSDRLSETVQLLIARKIGKVSVQLAPTFVNRNYVTSIDDQQLFALGGGLRVPVAGKFSLIVDYFHTFRSKESISAFKAQGIRFYDALGVGIEILTAGHVFHMNFTNATEILENRFVPRTITSWTKGQFRWGFTISRDFNLFWKKDHKK